MATSKKKKTCKTLKAGAHIGGADAEKLKKKLIRATAGRPDELRLDCSAATDIDAIGVGLLAAAGRQLSEGGGRLRMKNVSETIYAVVDTVGLGRYVVLEKAG